MRQEIIDKLKDINWNAIDVLRIGYDMDDPAPVVLWISVNPNSTAWESAY